MSRTPELDQVADARRALSKHAGYPTAYWVLTTVLLAAFAGIPLWLHLFPAATPFVQWSPLVIALASAAYSIIKRNRSGVQLPRAVGAYPSARPFWLACMVLSIAGFIATKVLVAHDQIGFAVGVPVVVGVGVLLSQLRIQSLIRSDVAGGRVQR
ncbi:hypothetical protein [Pseudonocardia phyllosphaerae]|uniref:hypothetical protein n=1 Tax=Pseudonocardia phyllosphaerae TaxID=3390502 RepID=UPI00397C25C3